MLVATAVKLKVPTYSPKHALGPMWVALSFFMLALVLLSSFRIGFLYWQAERVGDDYGQILLNGLRVDISSLCYLFAIPILVTLVSFLRNKRSRYLRPFLLFWYVFCLCFLVYLEVITPTFINEYDLRPNRLLVEYLQYPSEVSAMLWTGYKTEIFLSLFALLLTYKVSTSFYKRVWFEGSNLTLVTRVSLSLIIILLLAIGARSSFGHRPMNPAMVSFSNDHLLNDLSLNSSYSAIFALKQMGLENSSAKYYGTMETKQMLDIIKQQTNKAESDFQPSSNPTNNYLTASYQGKPKNLVILLQESLGARFVGGLGGLPLTPNLDKLMQQGWSFNNLYATGTRSVRGIEAITTGFTPTPSRSVVKLDKSQKDFFTIAKLLNKNDYHTQFIYGGESHFDNMKSFFLGNGFTDIVDIDDFAKVDFEGSWGASDEDLYDQAHLEFEQLQKQGKPFFGLVFTSSNHTPFEYPDHKIIQYDVAKNTRNNAAKYSDYALGKFFEKAKHSSYWQDTVFLVVADHDSRVSGASLVPVKNFQIPGVFLGGGIEAKQDNRLVSQIDLPPTMLSLIGVSGFTPMIGHDLTKPVPTQKQRALMQYDKNFAYMTGSNVTILQPDKAPVAFFYENEQLTETMLDPKWADIAKAHVLFGSHAYQNQWYK